VKYRFVVPSVRSSVSESATPFSAVIVNPAPVPVIVIFVVDAFVKSSAAASFARCAV